MNKKAAKNRALRAALLSGLVLPGLGQVYLKKYGRGAIVLLGMCFCITYVVHDLLARGLVEQVNQLAYKIMDGSISPDTEDLEALINLGPGTWVTELVSWLIIVFWLGGIADAYWTGARLDRLENAKKAS